MYYRTKRTGTEVQIQEVSIVYDLGTTSYWGHQALIEGGGNKPVHVYDTLEEAEKSRATILRAIAKSLSL